MKKKINFTVVTVCFNAQDSIRLTLESLKSQENVDIQHIIIDGGSTDRTLEIISQYKTDILVSEPDNGVYDAMDKSRRFVKNDWAIFLNAGDTFYNQSTCHEVASLLKLNNADIVFGDILPVYLPGTKTHDHPSFVPNVRLNLGYMNNRMDLKRESIHHQAIFYSKKVIKGHSFIEKDFPEASGEYKLLLSALQEKNTIIKYIPVLVTRFPLGGISTSNFHEEWQRYTRAKDYLLEKYGKSVTSYTVDEFHGIKHPIAQMQLAQRFRRKAFKILKGSFLVKIYFKVENRLMFRINEMFEANLSSSSNHLDSVHRQIIEENKLTNAILSQKVAQQLSQEASIANKEITELIHYNTTLRKEALDAFAKLNEDLSKHLDTVHHQLLIEKNLRIQELQNNLGNYVNQDLVSKLERNLFSLSTTTRSITEGRKLQDDPISIFSQWNEDGIISRIVDRIPVIAKKFVELGCGDFKEANTRYLAESRHWSGLIVDGDTGNYAQILQWSHFWKYDITAKCEFIEPNNVNEILKKNKFVGEVGLLSIDIDGMDYWVWRAIDCINPQIVVCEFNGFFGSEESVTIPYQEGFSRFDAHFSGLYAGSSLGAIQFLAKEKGYKLVALNTGMNNAFFVRSDLSHLFDPSEISTIKDFRLPHFREARNESGELTFQNPLESLREANELPLLNVESKNIISVGELLDGIK